MLDLCAVKWVKPLQREKNREPELGAAGGVGVCGVSVGLPHCVSNDEREEFERYSTLMFSQKTSKYPGGSLD